MGPLCPIARNEVKMGVRPGVLLKTWGKHVNVNTMSLTYNPKKKKRRRTHGFLARKRKKGGRVLLSRRRKGRKELVRE